MYLTGGGGEQRGAGKLTRPSTEAERNGFKGHIRADDYDDDRCSSSC